VRGAGGDSSESSLMPVSAQGGGTGIESTQTLTLSEAIETAFRQAVLDVSVAKVRSSLIAAFAQGAIRATTK
jgi:hypothetical protein